MFNTAHIIIQINDDYIVVPDIYVKNTTIKKIVNEPQIKELMKKVVQQHKNRNAKIKNVLITDFIKPMNYFKLKTELPTWNSLFMEELKKPYMIELKKYVDQRRTETVVIPKPELTLIPFEKTPYYSTKVVILGQEPYIQNGYSDGLAFSTKQLVRPPALRNIFAEIYDDYFGQFKKALKPENVFQSNNLDYWTKQGVLLLNCVLTAEENITGAHAKKGWEQFVATMISKLNDYPYPIVFLLWGRYAQAFKKVIDLEKHHVLEAGHPSIGDSSWFGCKHFTKANDLIIQHRPGDVPVNWGIFK